jgi:uncharacterized membrane protein
MMILPTLAVAALAVGAVFLFRRFSAPKEAGQLSLEVLRERFARGEINREQFEEMRGILSR